MLNVFIIRPMAPARMTKSVEMNAVNKVNKFMIYIYTYIYIYIYSVYIYTYID
jgi:hypothetical protein